MKSSLYKQEKVANARSNIAKYDWAKAEKDLVTAVADEYLALGEDFWWDVVTSQKIPRSFSVNQEMVCPVCGADIYKEFGNYPWKMDPVKLPWKLICPKCESPFPSNDFEAYYKSGLNIHGRFEPGLADKTLLVNKLYPDKPANWCVDDGYGGYNGYGSYAADTCEKYLFIAYYNHWGLWYNAHGYGVIQSALDAFRDSYLYTGDEKYAHIGAILLDRIADVYPEMDSGEFKWEEGFLNSHGGTGLGNILGSIWETILVPSFIRAYDAFKPAISCDATINYLKKRAEASKLTNRKLSADDIKRNIEDGILRQILPGVRRCRLEGNMGMQQSCIALAAVVLNSLPESRELIEFNNNPLILSENPRAVTGGGLQPILIDYVDRDGQGNECAPGYNYLWLEQLRQVADVMDGHELDGLDASSDLYKNPKFIKMFKAFYPLLLSGSYTAAIGDTGGTGTAGVIGTPEDCIKGFEKTGDIILAQLAYYLNHNSIEGLHGDIFSADPYKVAAEIQGIIMQHGELRLTSVNMTGFGFAALRDGEKSQNAEKCKYDNMQRDVWVYCGHNGNHGHADSMELGMHAFGTDIAPELGYPEYTGPDPKRLQWESNTVSHNTVVVDNSKQQEQFGGTPLHFDYSDMVKLMDSDAAGAYKQTSTYRRTTAMIKVDEADSYVVDLFRVAGGKDHNFSFHSNEGTVTVDGLNLTDQSAGTYAGPDIGYAERYDSVDGWEYSGSGYHYLINVQRDNAPVSQFSVDWKIDPRRSIKQDDLDIHLKLTMLTQADDVALADGLPPQRPDNPDRLRYLLVHRSGENLQSLFTSVLQPYKGSPYIEKIENVPISKIDSAISLLSGCNSGITDSYTAIAIKVVLKNGRTDYIVNSLDCSAVYEVDGKFKFKGFFGVYSEINGRQVYGYINDGEFIGEVKGKDCVSGVVTDFTRELSSTNAIDVKLDESTAEKPDDKTTVETLKGRYVYVQNDGIRNAVYEIKDAESLSDGSCRLDIGDVTLIRKYADLQDFSKGYLYDIAEGQKISIPLSVSANLPTVL